MQQQETFRNIFNKEPGTSDTVKFLREIVREHPYFGAAHFYLLKNSQDDSGISGKSALFFNDPFLLNAGLNEKKTISFPEVKTATEPAKSGTSEIVREIEKEHVMPSRGEEMLFEPLYASDYFAYRGIKLNEDMPETDKLGKQLKSFTAWLKTMKKMQPGKLPETSNAAETAVQNLAEKSNTGEEVLTEAMAEAFIIQEKQEKAVEIYEKLSLLNPSKNAYFAAKIESLKQ